MNAVLSVVQAARDQTNLHPPMGTVPTSLTPHLHCLTTWRPHYCKSCCQDREPQLKAYRRIFCDVSYKGEQGRDGVQVQAATMEPHPEMILSIRQHNPYRGHDNCA